ncbi:hypothetical protein Z517_10572 [Fonsecaea pedrosoi CBS 271.37]|uniref:N,N-dimethylformamidase beta subunit-like C-terminal domain-containing protein n=1 Tax=Fonsecaea pedrosoi CBS 271.37 TaxID=1442368 RepID=A0A0D2EN63_9EURO|nr:uncharacterized protein Z517_10572 [Fonsecaea pedrosoi CBS 271.37]KIW75827.1 hypothetical protein Z517_10572 [Fonsecaea pedrosoi CBS 271.37]
MARPPSEPDYAWSRPGGLVEFPGAEPGNLDIWVYCDKFSYHQHESVSLRTYSAASVYDIEIIKDGVTPLSVFHEKGLPGHQHETPSDAYAVGCNWPEALSIPLDEETWSPGYYVVIIRATDRHRRIREREGFFIVKAKNPLDADFVLIHTTCTVLAYNDWGGANHYRGLPDGYQNDTPTPLSSTQRPIARGMIRIPDNAPREGTGDFMPGVNWTPRYLSLEYSWYWRYSRHYADAGYATYERPFVLWAESAGYRIHHMTQTDLQDTAASPLDGYRCAVIVGHDEYWTWEQRDTIDQFVDRGGSFARFGGNFAKQVRLSSDLKTQYYYGTPDNDPESKANPPRTTTSWEWPEIQRPAAQTVGLCGLTGVYARYGVATPRSSGGFLVYRPDHWALDGTQLFYGDTFGGNPVNIAAFEVDGCQYTFRQGLPYPTFEDGAPSTLEIIAMCPAVLGEEDRWNGSEPIGGPTRDKIELMQALFKPQKGGSTNMPNYLKGLKYGSGMIASFTRQKGEVFCAGTAEWVVGLKKRDPCTEIITKNVLNKFIGKTGRRSGCRL